MSFTEHEIRPPRDGRAMTGTESRSMGDAIGVDIGGTGIKAVRLAGGHEILESLRAPTPRDDASGQRTAAAVADLIDALGGAPGAPVGVGTPGILDERLGVVRLAKNLGWSDLPLRDLLEDRLGHAVSVGHDVRSGAIAETSLAAATDRPQIFVPIGTGISMAIVVGDEPFGDGWAGEIGVHRIIQGHERAMLEDVASAAALARRLRVADGKAVISLVTAGDPPAVALWREAVSALAEALAWTVVAIDPARIIVGGGLAGAGTILFSPLRAELAVRLGDRPVPAVEAAVLGDLAGAVGAGLLARRRHAAGAVTAAAPM